MLKMTRQIALRSLQTSAIFFSFILGTFVASELSSLPARAYDLGNGQTIFLKSPRLIRAAASQISLGAASTYQFTIEVPKNADAALKAVTIVQKTSPERIKFDVSQSKAFIGDSFAGGPNLVLASVGGSEPSEDNSVTIVFDKPVEPETTVTISLKALHNPQFGGVY